MNTKMVQGRHCGMPVVVEVIDDGGLHWKCVDCDYRCPKFSDSSIVAHVAQHHIRRVHGANFQTG